MKHSKLLMNGFENCGWIDGHITSHVSTKAFAVQLGNLFWNLPRHQEITINRLRLLQSKLKAGLHKLGLHETGLCDSCGTIENSYHFIMECNVTASLRSHLKCYFAQINKDWIFQSILSDSYAMTCIFKYASAFKISI